MAIVASLAVVLLTIAVARAWPESATWMFGIGSGSLGITFWAIQEAGDD